MEVKINREIRNYTESMFFGLSMRQFVFSVLAILVAVGLYFLLKPYFGTEKVISGNAKADSTVTVLLPKCVDNASANDSSVVISHLENGTEGIFLLKEVTEQSCAEINGKTFYYDDICEYSMFGEDHFAVILSDGAIRFNADLFDGAITSFPFMRVPFMMKSTRIVKARVFLS